jgi:topoisomerase-4 subunit A
MRLKEFQKNSRAKRGLVMLRELKSKPHRIRGFFIVHEETILQFRTENGEVHHAMPFDLTVSDRYSNGSFIIDTDSVGEVTEVWRQTVYKKPFDTDEK